MEHSTFKFSQQHDIRNQPGAPSWFELATPDPAAAAEYLGELNGWTFEEIEMAGNPYRVIMLDGHEIGGIRKPGPDEAAPQWNTYTTVADIDAFARRAAEHGGSVVVPPIVLGDAGRMAIVKHPTAGMQFGFEYSRPFS